MLFQVNGTGDLSTCIELLDFQFLLSIRVSFFSLPRETNKLRWFRLVFKKFRVQSLASPLRSPLR